ncbi:slipin family protein [Candidatus Peregrinibacteria bacterium]|nr:slipin family protein [Candidatus Peregrinibacteria bacterium]
MEIISTFWSSIAIAIGVILIISIRQVNQYERGIKFLLGKFTCIAQPGWRLVIPVFQSMQKVDIRVRALDVPDQESLTKDNIPIKINAVIYFKVADAAKAILAVENFLYATSQLAQTTMRNAIGEVTLDHLLANKEEVSSRIQQIVDKMTDEWGIDVQNVELKDIVLPDSLKRVIARQAEAEREKRAVIIASEGEVASAENMAKAATTLSSAPGALHLRTLASINDISASPSNTTVWMVPIEVLRAVEALKEKLGNK